MISPHKALLLGVVPLLVAGAEAPLIAQPRAVQQSTTVTRPPAQPQHVDRGSRAGYRRHGQYRGAHRQPAPLRRHRQLVSPLGSAANVRPGGYQQLYGSPNPEHGAAPLPVGGYYPQAYVVYVDTVVEPPIYGESRQVAGPAPQQAPPPITIINQLPNPGPSSVGTVAEPPITALPPAPEPRRPRSTEPQSVFLDIRPADATIYLDDEPLGTALDLTSRSPLTLPPGVYILEVTHPAFDSQRLVFGVDDGDGVHVVVDLTATKPTRRTRVR